LEEIVNGVQNDDILAKSSHTHVSPLLKSLAYQKPFHVEKDGKGMGWKEDLVFPKR